MSEKIKKYEFKVLVVNLWPYGVMLLLAVAFFARNLFLGEIFVTPTFGLGDISLGGVPLKVYLSQVLSEGRLPLWTDGVYSGLPIFAETLIGGANPVSLIYLLFNPFYAHSVNFFIQFLVCMLFMYKYARLINLSKYSAVFTSVVFTFSGFFTLRIIHHNVLDAALWFPAVFYFTERISRKFEARSIVFLAIVFAVQILSGGSQFAVYSIFAGVLYVIFGLFFRSGKEERHYLPAVGFNAAVVVAILLSAVQIIPAIEYIGHSVRAGGVRTDALNDFPFYLQELIGMILPKIWGTPLNYTYRPPFERLGVYWENTPFIGFIAFIFAFAGLFYKRNRYKIFFILLFVVSALLAAGRNGPLWFVLQTPPFNYFRVSARFMLFGVFSASVLAGYGIQYLSKFIKGKEFITLFVIALSVFELFRFGLEFNPTYKYEEWFTVPKTAKLISEINKDARIYNMRVLKSLDRDVPFVLTKRYQGWSEGLDKYARLPNYLLPNLNLIYGIDNARGKIALEPKRSTEFENFRESFLKQGFDDNGNLVIDDNTLKLFNLSSINFLLSYSKLINDNLELVGDVEVDDGITVYVYKNSKALPNTYVVFGSVLAKSDEEIFSTLASPNFNPETEVVIEGGAALIEGAAQGFQDVIGLRKEKDGEEVFVNVALQEPGLLVLTDTYYPGWKVYVDGKEDRIYRANYNFRAVRVPEGKHDIIFKYKPESFLWGLRITMGTVAGVLVVGVIGGIEKIRVNKG